MTHLGGSLILPAADLSDAHDICALRLRPCRPLDRPAIQPDHGLGLATSLYPLFVAAVVTGAQRLPVRLVPEQRMVRAVRNDVINHCGRLCPALSLAHDTQHVGRVSQEGSSGLLPPATVSTLSGCALVFAPRLIDGRACNSIHGSGWGTWRKGSPAAPSPGHWAYLHRRS